MNKLRESYFGLTYLTVISGTVPIGLPGWDVYGHVPGRTLRRIF